MEQDDFTHGSPEKVQEIIFYLSSRLRVAAIASLDPENASKARNWMIPTLMYEVVMTYIRCCEGLLKSFFFLIIAVGFVGVWNDRGHW